MRAGNFKKWITTAFVLIFIIVNILYSGVVFADCWRWFVVPLTGLPEIHIKQAIGLCITVQIIMLYPLRDMRLALVFLTANGKKFTGFTTEVITMLSLAALHFGGWLCV